VGALGLAVDPTWATKEGLWLPSSREPGQRERLGSLPSSPVEFWPGGDGAEGMVVRVIFR